MPSKSKRSAPCLCLAMRIRNFPASPELSFSQMLAARTIRHQMDVAPLPSLAVPHMFSSPIVLPRSSPFIQWYFSWFACCVFAGICLGFPVGFTILSPIRQRWETARSWTDHFFLGSVAVRFISPPQGRFFFPAVAISLCCDNVHGFPVLFLTWWVDPYLAMVLK